MNTQNYKTKTIYTPRANGIAGLFWPIAIDIGYSSVKTFSPNCFCQFPYYAKKVKDYSNLGLMQSSFILYEDLEDHTQWLVGDYAERELSSDDTNASTEMLCNRNRYYTENYLVSFRTGLGMSMLSNSIGKPGSRKIKVQTGLPPKYIQEDGPVIKKRFSGRHHFSVRVGNSAPVEFDFSLSGDDILLMKQPLGTVYSIGLDKNATPSNYRDLFSKNLLVFDPGYGTFDTFTIRNNRIGDSLTYADLGMSRVFENTIARLRNEYGTGCTLPVLQRYLETNQFPAGYDMETFEKKTVAFDEILEEESRKICEAAILRVRDSMNLFEVDCICLTGGTSAAWGDIIRARLSMMGIRIIDGNVNDPDVPLSLANCRGYYEYLLMVLRRESEHSDRAV